MDTLLKIFQQVQQAYKPGSSAAADLRARAGYYGTCPVLKLQKQSWTNDSMAELPSGSGIFFSIWSDEKAMQSHRLLYNIHALKLRDLRGYRLTSRAFADEFRIAFEPFATEWPNVSTDYGPQTLMQGWIEIKPASIKKDIQRLMRRFESISTIIDQLLAKRPRSN